MLLPGRLKETTLGDLLGNLHRAEATGRLVLIDDQGERHEIVVREGLVQGVNSTWGPRLGEVLEQARDWGPAAARAQVRLGEYLVERAGVSEDAVSSALGRLNLLKLDQLFLLRDASIRFYVARPRAEGEVEARALDSGEFLVGRRRKRDPATVTRRLPSRGEALAVLGLEAHATQADIRHAFRVLAQRCHPDRHPGVSAVQKTRLIVEFSRLTHAYHVLLG
jgi:hypothetical protein